MCMWVILPAAFSSSSLVTVISSRLCNTCPCFSLGVVGVCGGGEHHPLHHQCPAEPWSGSAHGRSQQLGRRRGALCTQVQHFVRWGELLWGRQSSCQRTKGVALELFTPFLSFPISLWSFYGLYICFFLRASCAPQTPSGVSRVFPPSRARPLLCSSTLASCWIRASSTSSSPWSCAGLCCSRAASSCWRSGWRKIR